MVAPESDSVQLTTCLYVLSREIDPIEGKVLCKLALCNSYFSILSFK